jgi:hypothetical protein
MQPEPRGYHRSGFFDRDLVPVRTYRWARGCRCVGSRGRSRQARVLLMRPNTSLVRDEVFPTCDNAGDTHVLWAISVASPRMDLVHTLRSRNAPTAGPHLHRAGHVRRGAPFSVCQLRPHAEVSVLDPSGDLGAEARRTRPHLIVANRVPRGSRVGAFWVEVAEPVGGGGPRASAPR